jgi:nucleoside-diphosphate-sugar epimerase
VIRHLNDSPRKPDRVVLLGARGFIAQALRRALEARGIPVLAIGSLEIDLASPGASGKLAAQLKPADAVVMLSALTPDKGRDVATLMKNLAMMQNVCTALDQSPCAQLVYFSSDAVYDLAVARVTEETPAAPQDLYGVMHLAREIMARGLAKIPLAVLRVTMVYGAGDTHNSYGPNRFRRMAQKDGKITLFGGGEESRDHVHVQDVASIAVACLERKSAGTLNVATGVSSSFRRVAEFVASQFPGKAEVVATPRANPVTHRHYDITNLIKAFPGHRFLALEEGLAAVHKQEGGAD